MSLAKIPLTFIASYAFMKCMTPPHPAPVKEERVRATFLETEWYIMTAGPSAVTRALTLPAPSQKLMMLAGLLEIATILAWNYPASPLSELILSTLVFSGGRPDQLHLTTMSAVGCALIVAGTLIRLSTFRYLGRYFRFHASIQKDHQLITSGPYSFVRHPSYSGFLLTHPGWVLWQCAEGSWVRESGLWNTIGGRFSILTYAIVIVFGSLYLTLMRMGNEDEALHKEFGKKWEEWVKNVPHKLVPGIY
ncbi:hypothetical protein CPB84DRAFT_1816978 [Gymnopilus junonius]|uniref:Protein-S-isoprenylcysteine O-methyltransferase n=1 Tax=Gymnopilus junonius TaxID=109634 RepID=A0A9P5NGY5_GYMJU|nr:hypothetical protein CPB84DRAFT_1816978 [Gymnopilus junonius]